MVKNLPAMPETRDVGSIPGSGRSHGKRNATHSSILAWKILWTEEPGGLQSMGSKRVGHEEPTRLLCPWDFPGKNTGVGCHLLFQRIFSTWGSNPHLICLLLWQVDSVLVPRGKPSEEHIKPKYWMSSQGFSILKYLKP